MKKRLQLFFALCISFAFVNSAFAQNSLFISGTSDSGADGKYIYNMEQSEVESWFNGTFYLYKENIETNFWIIGTSLGDNETFLHRSIDEAVIPNDVVSWGDNGGTPFAGLQVINAMIVTTDYVNNVTCNGDNDGSISLSTTEGSGTYNYVWGGGETTNTITELAPGNYNVTVTDANGLGDVVMNSFTITEPDNLIVNEEYTNSCGGGSNGTIFIDAVGGLPDYFYLWSDESNSQERTNLAIGDYVYTVTDDNGCTASNTITIADDVSPEAFAGNDVNVCIENLHTFANATAENYSSITWTHDGIGTLDDNNSLNPTYTPNYEDSEVVNFHMTVSNDGACPAKTDDIALTFSNMPQPSAGIDDAVCALTYNFTGMNAMGGANLWTQLSGPGSSVFSDDTDSYAIVTVSQTGDYVYKFNEAGTGCDGSDTVAIQFNGVPVAFAGSDATICEGENYTVLDATSIAATYIEWKDHTSGGELNFSNPYINNPSYYPNHIDISMGIAQLIMEVKGGGECGFVRDTMNLTILPTPKPTAGVNDTVCSLVYTLSGIIDMEGESLWTQLSGPGSSVFSDATSYTPIVTVDQVGEYLYKFNEVGNGCDGSDTVAIKFNGVPVAFAGSDATICEGEDYPLSDATSEAAGSIVWKDLTSDSGINFSDASNAKPVYSPNSADISNGTVQLVLQVNGMGECGLSTDTMTITILPSPKPTVGDDDALCGLDYNLVGTLSSEGIPNWTLESGPGTAAFVAAASEVTDVTVTMPGVYDFIFEETANGCTGSANVMVTFYEDGAVNNIKDTICNGNNYILGDSIYTKSGIYSDTILTINGCDSIVELNLHVRSSDTTQLSESICQGAEYTFGEQTLFSAGTYFETFMSMYDCDSVVELLLTVNDPITNSISESICSGHEYAFGEQTLFESGEYTEIFVAASGCDSTVTLNLLVQDAYNDSISEFICEGNTYTFGSETLTVAGTYVDTLESSQSCDSIVTLLLSVGEIINTKDTVIICEGETYTFGTQSLIMAGNYEEGFVSVSTCDSIVQLTLFVNSLPSQPSKPVGPVVVNNLGASSNYSCEEINDAIAYEWVLMPEEAGIMLSNANNANVTWSPEFLGQAYVSVKAINDCGASYFSESVLVEINADLVANFEYTISHDTVSFTNVSLNASMYSWSFGDGGQSQEENPIHIYKTQGYFNVCLNIFNLETQESADTCIEIVIGDTATLCKASFESVVEGNNVTFTNSSETEFVAYYWSFGDGITSTLENPIHYYEYPGYYVVTLTATASNADCNGIVSHEIYIVPEINSNFCSADFEFVVNEGTVTLINTSEGLYTNLAWNIGNGIVANSDTVVHTFTNSNYYTVCLTVYNDTNACFDQVCKDVLIQLPGETTCKSDFNFFVNAANVSFTPKVQGEITNYRWDFQDGTLSFDKNPTHTYSNPGVYNVELKALDTVSQCFDVETKIVIVTTVEDAVAYASFESFVEDSLAVFSNTSVGEYTDVFWDFGDGRYATTFDARHVYTKTGVYDVMVTIYNENTNSLSEYTATVYVEFDEEQSCLSQFSYYNETNLVAFYDESIGESLEYFWDFGNGNYSTDQNPLYTYADAGYYDVILTIKNTDNGCLDATYQTIYVYDSETSICNAAFTYYPEDNGINFSSESLGDYTQIFWDFGDGKNSNSENPWHEYDKAGYYEVSFTVIDTLGGCFDTQFKTVMIDGANNNNPYINARFDYFPNSENNEVAFTDVSVGDIGSWYWNFGDNTAAVSLQSPNHMYETNDYYRTCLTVENENLQSTKCKFIAVGDVSNSSTSFFTYFADSVTSTGHFKNQSLGNIAAYYWDFGDGYSSTLKSPSHTYADTGYYAVCLTTYSESGLQKTHCVDVNIGNIVENPCVYSCVWPGDANNDLEANHYDIMTIGLNYNLKGPKREDATIFWQGQFAENWSTYQLDSTNNKYGDCNGDGAINYDDILAIEDNFAYSHFYQPDIKSSNWELICIWDNEEEKAAASRSKAKAMLGGLQKEEGSLYGIGFEIEVVGGEHVVWDSVEVNFDASWIGVEGENLLSVTYVDTVAYIINVGITRTDQEDAVGSGEIAEISFLFKEGFGKQDISLTVTTQGGIESTGDDVSVDGSIILSLQSPVEICEGEDVLLDAGVGFANYTWSNGVVDTNSITVSDAGLYIVTVSDTNGVSASDTIEVIVHALPIIDLGDDISQEESVMLNAGDGFVSYQWSTNDTIQNITVTESNMYWVEVMNEFGCFNSDTINVTIITGVKEQLLSNLNVYPNPNNGQFWIDYPFNENASIVLEVINSLGRMVWKKNIERATENRLSVETEQLRQGVYYLKVMHERRIGLVRFVVF